MFNLFYFKSTVEVQENNNDQINYSAEELNRENASEQLNGNTEKNNSSKLDVSLWIIL